MTTLPHPVVRLHEHRLWSHRRLVDACRPLTHEQLHHRFPIGMGSVWATLVHLHAAEQAWLDALDDPSSGMMVTPEQIPDWPALDAAWARSEQRWQALLANLTDDDLARPITKRRYIPEIGAGAEYTTPLQDVLLHLCTHAVYTTAQCVNMLRHLGVQPLPDVQMIAMARGQRE